MKKALNIRLKLFLIGILFLMIPFTTSAQKLPNVQEKSLRAPSTVKVDGKRPEWDNLIQAYNKATGISYIISNDDEKLYLTVLATDMDIANKIIYAGLTFTINGSGKAHDEGGMAITFPFLYKKDHRQNLPLLDYHKEVTVWNQQLTDKTKDIIVAGVKGIKDTISIYNPEGIKAAALFAEDEVFTYELAIPLKYLGLSVEEPKPFVYSIKLNGSTNYPLKGEPSIFLLNRDGTVTSRPVPVSREVFITYANQNAAVQHVRSYLRRGVTGYSDRWNVMSMYGPSADTIKGLISPTYFSGEYTLAK